MSIRAAVLLLLVPLVYACSDDAPSAERDVASVTSGGGTFDDAGAAPTTCDADAKNAPVTVFASAPLGISEAHLGRPVDARFEPFAGEGGATLFPKSRTRGQDLHRMEHSFVAMDSKRSVSANIGAIGKSWAFGASAGGDTEQRFASYRASQLVEFREIDDATTIRPDAPARAVWYIARIYYGRSYELIVHGEKRRFNKKVKARFFFAKGSVKTFAEQNGLSVAAQGRGLEPVDGDAIFAEGEEEISKAYKQSGDPVPIFVEYRSIPQSCVPSDEAVEWLPPWHTRVSFDRIDIYRHDESTWNIEARCLVNDRQIVLENPIIWSKRTGIGSRCTGGVPGPQGDPDFCSYKLYWEEDIELVEGDRVRCGITGSQGSGDSPRPFVPSEFSEVVTKESKQAATTFQDGDARAEYRVHYTIVPGVDSMATGLTPATPNEGPGLD